MAGLQDHRRCHLTPLELAERLLVTERELIVAKDRVEREQEAYRMKLRALCALQAQYSLPLYSGSARQSLPVAAAAMHMQPARHQDQARTVLTNSPQCQACSPSELWNCSVIQAATVQVEGGDQGLPAAAEAGQGSLVLPVHTSQAGAGTEPSTVRKRAAEQDQVLTCLNAYGHTTILKSCETTADLLAKWPWVDVRLHGLLAGDSAQASWRPCAFTLRGQQWAGPDAEDAGRATPATSAFSQHRCTWAADQCAAWAAKPSFRQSP